MLRIKGVDLTSYLGAVAWLALKEVFRSPGKSGSGGGVGEKLQRAYRYSELRKLQLWFEGKTLHWALYLASATLLIEQCWGYYYPHFYAVRFGRGRWVWWRDAGDRKISG